MNWLSLLMSILSSLPTLIQTVEQIHSGASGATKKAKVMAFIDLGTAVGSGIAQQVDPKDAGKIQAVTAAVSGAIDANVAVLNAAGVLKTDGSSPIPPSISKVPAGAPTLARSGVKTL
jgi:hypothetical protein